jgi:hypothetical protein
MAALASAEYLRSLYVEETQDEANCKLRFWNSHLRQNSQSSRDTILRELQEGAPHALPNGVRPMGAPKRS